MRRIPANNRLVPCLLALILSGCVRDTTLDSGVERRVVVEFVLTEDSIQSLYLSLTRGPGEPAAPVIQEAEIKLINVSDRFEPEHLFVKATDSQWTLAYSGKPGDQYRLEVKVDEYETVWAEQAMPNKVDLVEAAPGHGDIPKYVGYGAFYTIDSVPDFLIIRGTKRDKETGEYIPVEELCTDYPGVEEMNATDRFYDGNPKWRTGTGPYFTEETGWVKANYVYHDSPVAGMDGVWTYLYPNLIGKGLHEGFLFINRVDENHAGLDRLFVFSAGSDYSTGEEDLSARGFCVGGSFDVQQDRYHEYLIFSSLSPDYGRFVKETYQLKKVHEGGDLSSIYFRDNIHSNIQGGLGIFGAMVADTTDFQGNYTDPAYTPPTVTL